jgi:hypothetical protein
MVSPEVARPSTSSAGRRDYPVFRVTKVDDSTCTKVVNKMFPNTEMRHTHFEVSSPIRLLVVSLEERSGVGPRLLSVKYVIAAS